MRETAQTRACTRCGEKKAHEEFYADGRGGRVAVCKSCSRERALANYHHRVRDPVAREAHAARSRDDYRMRRGDPAYVDGRRILEAKPEVRNRRLCTYLTRTYGITLADWDRMYAAQGGCCAACGRPVADRYYRADADRPKAATDHCHKTGRVRGILCHGCNVAVGMLSESPARADGLAAYIRRNHQVKIAS